MSKLIAGSFARQVGSMGAGWLIAHGLAEQSRSAELVTLIGGVAVYALMQGWSLLHKAKKVAA